MDTIAYIPLVIIWIMFGAFIIAARCMRKMSNQRL